jgi:hypothetical protein
MKDPETGGRKGEHGKEYRAVRNHTGTIHRCGKGNKGYLDEKKPIVAPI